MDLPPPVWLLHGRVLLAEAAATLLLAGYTLSQGRIGIFNDPGTDISGLVVALILGVGLVLAAVSSLLVAALRRHAKPWLVVTLAHLAAPVGVALLLAAVATLAV